MYGHKFMRHFISVVMIYLVSCVINGYAVAGDTTAIPAPEPWPTTFINTQGQRYVFIPGGTFQMGPVEAQRENEHPRHTVQLTSYYLSSFEVTKGQFRAFASKVAGYDHYPELDPNGPGYEQNNSYQYAPGDQFPLFAIDWHAATRYAQWLSEKEGRHYRLPTEAEWEYACRAGTETLRWWGDTWHVGMALVRETNYERTPYRSYVIPGTAPANPWGFYEILGNAAEWTNDWYGPYLEAASENPAGPTQGRGKIIRGGSVEWMERVVTSYLRSPYEPQAQKAGIRLVCIPNQGPVPTAPVVPPEPPADPTPTTEVMTVALSPAINLALVRVPAGHFQMGSHADEFGHGRLEEPQTQVTISYSYLIGRYEVTQAQYELVMGTNPSCYRHPQHPVEMTPFWDAVKYCEQLTKREREMNRLDLDEVYRLPTEPEWEYACRAGTKTSYSFGDDVDFLSYYGWCDMLVGTHPVGEKRPNPWGIYDMHGNVQEWCWGVPVPLPGGELVDPLRRPGLFYKKNSEQWDALGPERVVRGGGWCFAPHACRSGIRQGFDLREKYNFIGFRVVRAPSHIDVSVVPRL